jgi:hypothetical protein
VRAGIEAKRQVKIPGFFRYSVNDDAANSDYIGRHGQATCGVTKERAAQALSLPIPINGQAR